MKVVGLQTFIWQNNTRSLILLLLFPFLLGLILYLVIFGVTVSSHHANIAGATIDAWSTLQHSAIYILAGVLVWFLIAWTFHKAMILGMTGAQPLERRDNKALYDIVENLCISRGVKTPSLYVIEDSSMNAFASGLSPNNAMIAFSRGLLDSLTPQEVEAVAAHELTHILNRDSRFMIIAIIFVGIIQTIAEIFLRTNIVVSDRDEKGTGSAYLVILLIKIAVYIIGFFITLIVQLAISRRREYLADAGSVELTKSSEHLISALQKISGDSRIEAIANRNVAQLCIENPLEHGHSFMSDLLSTHPSVQDRIKALQMIG